MHEYRGVHDDRDDPLRPAQKVIHDLDGNVARPPELLPFGNELAVRLENLNAVVGAVGDVDASHRIESDAVRRVEFARPVASENSIHLTRGHRRIRT
jgi:hypothetical protein